MRGFRSKNALSFVLGGAVVGALLLSPAGAHVNDSIRHLWNDHLERKVKNAAEEESIVKVSAQINVPAGGVTGSRVFCPSGYEAIGGGVDVDQANFMVVVSSSPIFGRGPRWARLIQTASGRYGSASGWYGLARNDDAVAHPMQIAATCVRI